MAEHRSFNSDALATSITIVRYPSTLKCVPEDLKMSISLTSPVTGGAQTGLTSPTYTLSTDTAPDVNGKQYAITALGGTQTGVSAHSVSSPFTISFFRPRILRQAGVPNPATGVISSVPNNTYKLIVRKGVVPLAGQNTRTATFTLSMDIPAGADLADSEDIRAAVSLLVGSVSQLSSGLGDTLINGVM